MADVAARRQIIQIEPEIGTHGDGLDMIGVQMTFAPVKAAAQLVDHFGDGLGGTPRSYS
jgi:hypothetical protein